MRNALKAFAVATTLLIATGHAYSQSAQTASTPFAIINPGHFNLTLFGGGYMSDQYGATEEGFQFEQSVTSSVDLVGRSIGYQLYIGNGFGNPLAPHQDHEARLNFGRFEGGLDIKPFEGTNVFILGGGDVGDSHAAIFEGDLSSWFLLSAKHPINLSVSTVYNSENQVSTNEIDLKTILLYDERYLITAGAGGAIYAGGFVHGIEGQGGPDFGIYFPDWQIGINAQAGYGDAKQYGELTLFKQFDWIE